jgi:hypothetical protein
MLGFVSVGSFPEFTCPVFPSLFPVGRVARAFAFLGLGLTAEYRRHDTIADTSLEGMPLRVPRARVCERGGFRFCVMPKRLKRIYGFGHLHFLTFSCYRRLPLLRSA